jgi:hypothetical protein
MTLLRLESLSVSKRRNSLSLSLSRLRQAVSFSLIFCIFLAPVSLSAQESESQPTDTSEAPPTEEQPNRVGARHDICHLVSDLLAVLHHGPPSQN